MPVSVIISQSWAPWSLALFALEAAACALMVWYGNRLYAWASVVFAVVALRRLWIALLQLQAWPFGGIDATAFGFDAATAAAMLAMVVTVRRRMRATTQTLREQADDLVELRRLTARLTTLNPGRDLG